MNQNFNGYPYGANNFYQQNQDMSKIKPRPIFEYITGGIDAARMYPMTPNQIVYLKDEQNNLLFERKTDANGIFSFKTYQLVEVKQADASNFATKTDLVELQQQIQNQINGIVNLLQGNAQPNNNQQKSEG